MEQNNKIVDKRENIFNLIKALRKEYVLEEFPMFFTLTDKQNKTLIIALQRDPLLNWQEDVLCLSIDEMGIVKGKKIIWFDLEQENAIEESLKMIQEELK